MIIAWFSCGAASAVATKKAIAQHPNIRIVYQHIATAHPDNDRFIADCERWYNRPIERIRSMFYRDQFDVITARRYINGPSGAPCTGELKRKVRKQFEADNSGIALQLFGMTSEQREIARAARMQTDGGNYQFPLIDSQVTKKQCYQIIQAEGIQLPEMYRLGFNNNNCIGCVKGGKGYWNMIRKHFPDTFFRMAELEKEIGATCIKGVSLYDLNPNEGKHDKPDIDCGLFCFTPK